MMMNHSNAAPADAAQRVAYSNLAHQVVGVLLGAVGISAGLEFFGVVSGIWLYAWPVLLLVVGLFVPLFIWAVARRHHVRLAQVLADPQQRQHFILSGVIFGGGLAETLRVAGVLPGLLGYAWPLALILIGLGFVTHTQHGTSEAMASAVRAHRLLGGTAILAGLARGLQVGLGDRAGVVGLRWIVLILLTALQFLIYHEPEGAYATGDSHHHAGR